MNLLIEDIKAIISLIPIYYLQSYRDDNLLVIFKNIIYFKLKT